MVETFKVRNIVIYNYLVPKGKRGGLRKRSIKREFRTKFPSAFIFWFLVLVFLEKKSILGFPAIT